jgi:uncharacterized protein YndB with AHSA1/START domain
MQLHEEAGAVRREVHLPVERDEAWEAVTDPSWLGDELEERAAVVEEREEGRRLALVWDDLAGGRSLVEITLDDEDEGTRVTVVEIPLVTLRAVGAEVAAGVGGGAGGARMLACV